MAHEGHQLLRMTKIVGRNHIFSTPCLYSAFIQSNTAEGKDEDGESVGVKRYNIQVDYFVCMAVNKTTTICFPFIGYMFVKI